MPLPGAAPSPGPGAYNLKSNFTSNKHYMSGANFVSTSSRWTGAATKVDLPGPGLYQILLKISTRPTDLKGVGLVPQSPFLTN